ncbi:MAG: pyruvate kinase, partial [Promethearchaeota archaeon]
MSFRENTVKIVATLGPASSSKAMIEKLIKAGVDIFRLNFSHGTHEDKKELIKKIRSINHYVGILADIQGPKIRVGQFENDDSHILNVGQPVKIYEKPILGNSEKFSIPLEGFLNTMRVGDVFYVNDGIIKIKVIKKEQDHLVGEV